MLWGYRQSLRTNPPVGDIKPMKGYVGLYLRFCFTSRHFIKMSTITFANGGDNIGVYIPYFATQSIGCILVILLLFLCLVGICCFIGNALPNFGTLWSCYRAFCTCRLRCLYLARQKTLLLK